MLITVLPMMGDYFTNQLLSGASSTAMIGNVIDSQLDTSSQEAQGGPLPLLLAFLLVPDALLRGRTACLGRGVLMTLTTDVASRHTGNDPSRRAADSDPPSVGRRRGGRRGGTPGAGPGSSRASPGCT